MSTEKQKLCNIVEALPDDLSSKVIDYIEYLKFTSIIEQAPEELIIKDKDDLRRKLEEGIKDSENGRVCSIDEAFEKIEQKLVD